MGPQNDEWWRIERERRLADSGAVVITDRCMYRPGELLLSDTGAVLLEPELSDLGATRDESDDAAMEALSSLSLQRWNVPQRESLPELVHQLRAAVESRRPEEDPDADVLVSLNHVMCGEPRWTGGPAGAPERTPFSRSLGGTSGDDPDISVLDTGYDADLKATHPDVRRALRPDQNDRDRLQAPGGTTLLAEAGHGTFIFGLVLLVAPDLAIDPGRVLDPDGVCDDVQLSVELAEARHGAPVLNLSLGGYTFDDSPPPAASRRIEALAENRVVVAAAGNNGSTRPFWPAALKGVVAVAAIDDPDRPVPPRWTNRGPWVDVCTQGVDLLSTYVEGVYPTGPGTGPDFTGHPWAVWSGTSFATPLVAAEIARRVREARDAGAPISADRAWRDLAATLSPVPGRPGLGLLYPPPVDPRRP